MSLKIGKKLSPISLIISITLIGVFIFPYLVIITQVRFPLTENWPIFGEVFAFNTLQAMLSALISVSLGTLGGIGLIKLYNKPIWKWIDRLLLLPVIVPSLFIISTVVNFTQIFSYRFVGMKAIILVHVIINVGLVTNLIIKIIARKGSGFFWLSRVYGASTYFFYRSYLGSIKGDLLLLTSLVFLFSFTSFSVPLLLAENNPVSIELLIYETIKIDLNWGLAAFYSLIQFIYLWFLNYVLFKIPLVVSLKPVNNFKVNFYSPILLGIAPLLMSLVFIIAQLSNIRAAIVDFYKDYSILKFVFYEAVYSSFMIGLSIGILVLFVFCFILYHVPGKKIRQWMLSYTAPTTVFVGLSFIFLKFNFSILFLILGLLILYFPYLYRTLFDQRLDEINSQVKAGLIYTDDKWLIFKQLTFPQFRKSLLIIVSLTVFWSLGDFSLSSLIFERDITLALQAKTYLTQYRLSVSHFFLYFILVEAAVVIYLFHILLSFIEKKFLET